MTQAFAPLEPAGDAASALPFRVRSWSLDPSAAVPSALTGRKLLLIVLGLTASWVALIGAALLGVAFLVTNVLEKMP